MALTLANALVIALAIYTSIGLVFALAFALRGAGRIDPMAKSGSWGFRVLIIPASVALWPWLARRWWGGASEPPDEHNPHRDAVRKEKKP
ncbi:MAG: hypothetical protein HC897_15705 [Thermoanaerobaculia bacterium]|nr:hypothetical protein [Thermoanaerobaculia bacterium]